MKNKILLTIITIVVFSLQMFAQKTTAQYYHIDNYNEFEATKYLNLNTLDPIEGIWQSTDGFKYAIVKQALNYAFTGKYMVIILSHNSSNQFWKPNYIKGLIEKTTVDGVFNMDYYTANDYGNIQIQTCIGIIDGDAMFTFTRNDSGEKIILFILFPASKSSNNNPKSTGKSTGTGFAIASEGYIVTNNHVIENATTIRVKAINGSFSKSFSAKVIQSDKNNDLAIIKIDDYSFSSLGVLPYTIKSLSSNVGENIFELGYPLTASMGEEIKLTNGIISLKSGFQGDITSYQMTAPIQPGNSGAPMFDMDGNIVGIVNAKHLGAENAGYAIKSSYLNNLIESLTPAPKLTTQNSLIGKPLTEQVKLIKNLFILLK